MAENFRSIGWQPFFLTLAATALLAGCGKQGEVGRYSAPKEVPVDSTPALGESQQPDRMLAALVPHGEQAWFFKLVGPREAVTKQAETFDTFVRSVKFADRTEVIPEWTLPEGWEEAKSNSQLRFATLKIAGTDPPIEVSVAPLPWPPKNYVAMLHANVNRWRGQMQLKSISPGELPDQIREVKLPVGDTIFVDFKGTQRIDAMQPPFAGAGANATATKMPADDPPASSTEKSVALATDAEKGAEKSQTEQPKAAETKAPPAAPKAANEPKLPFEFKMPEDWTPVKNPTFAVAAFSTKDRSAAVEVSITPMFKQGGDLLMNVNRWRAMQLGLPEISADDLKTAAPAYKIDGRDGHFVQLVAPKDANPRQAITAALLKTGDTTWVFRMRGGADAVEKQQENFEKFLSSIKFGPGEK